jgi:hypothetical protein
MLKLEHVVLVQVKVKQLVEVKQVKIQEIMVVVQD